MNLRATDHIRITHPSGHMALVEVPYRKSWFKAKALAFQMLRSKLWAAPDGPSGIPMGDVQVRDLSAHGQAYWSSGAACGETEKRMAAELGERLEAAMERRRADLDRRIFLPPAHAFPVDAITRNA
jgi:hypothetical protein